MMLALGAGLWMLGWLLVRTHPDVSEMIASNPLRVRIKANVSLLVLWPLLAMALLNVGGTR